MITDKSHKTNRVQYTLSDEELIRLHTACIQHKRNLTSFTREAVLFYITLLDNGNVNENKVMSNIDIA